MHNTDLVILPVIFVDLTKVLLVENWFERYKPFCFISGVTPITFSDIDLRIILKYMTFIDSKKVSYVLDVIRGILFADRETK